jgi:hypothetical protein
VKKILVLASNPNNLSDEYLQHLHIEKELREIEIALNRNHQKQFELIFKLAVRVDDLQSALLYHQPTIIHFCGHGGESEGLILENEIGQEQKVSTEALSQLFSLFQDTIECVILNACNSEIQAEAISQHINYVIGMNQEIADCIAIKYAVGFYEALSAGRSYQEAHDFGRNAIALHAVSQSSIPVLKVKPDVALSIPKPSPIPTPENLPSGSDQGISIAINGSKISGGMMLVQGENNQLSQETYTSASSVETRLTQVEVIEILIQIEIAIDTAKELTATIKERSRKYLEIAKEELQSTKPNKTFAADDLKRMSQILKSSNPKVWQDIAPILGQLPPWLNVPRSYF